jgi:hypothetical protein
MALLKDAIIKENVFHFLADIPAYAYIAYINLTQVYLPNDYPEWEQFLLKHGWLILLGARLFIAVYDVWVRLSDGEEYIDELGKIRRKTIWMVIKEFFKAVIR